MTTQDTQSFDVIAALQELAKSKQSDLGLAQRLRDERLSAVTNIENDQSSLLTETRANGGYVMDPTDQWTRQNQFAQFLRGAVSPLNERVQQEDASLQNVLGQLLDYKKSTDSSGSANDLLKTRQLMADQGLDTSEIDAMLGVTSEVDPRAIDVTNKIGRLLAGEDTTKDEGMKKYQALEKLYGNVSLGRSNILSKLAGEDLRMTKADIEQIASFLETDAAKLIKGQGPVSDNERAMLAKAATQLRNGSLTMPQVFEELRAAYSVLSKYTGGSLPPQESQLGNEADKFKIVEIK